MRRGSWFFLFLTSVLLAGLRVQAAQGAPEFQQVYDLLRSNLPGITPADLDRAAVQGLIAQLGSKAFIESAESPTPTNSPVSKVDVFDGDLACLQIGNISTGLAAALDGELKRVSATNKLRGVVLDLRFASGQDYAATPAVLSLFLRKEQPILDWGEGMVAAKPVSQPLNIPVAVLINSQTRAASEALAAALRASGVALLLGGRTAGDAVVTKAFPLANGDRLRIAIAPLRLGDGKPMPGGGVKPDIEVDVPAALEKLYYANPYHALTNTTAAAGTNAPARRSRYGEAELVRDKKAGSGAPRADGEAGPELPLVQDPVLARALDVLKGLAVVRLNRS